MMHPRSHVAFNGEDHSTDILSRTPSNLQKHTALHSDPVCFAGLSGCGHIPYNQTPVVLDLVDKEQREEIPFSVEEIEYQLHLMVFDLLTKQLILLPHPNSILADLCQIAKHEQFP